MGKLEKGVPHLAYSLPMESSYKFISNVKVADAPTFSVAISGAGSIQYAEKDAKLTANIQANPGSTATTITY